MKPKQTRGDASEYTQKEFLRVSVEEAHRQWVDQLPAEKQVARFALFSFVFSHLRQCSQEDAPSASTFRLWRPFWVRLCDQRQAIGCVCVHHATHEMLQIAIDTVRRPCHVSKHPRPEGPQCRLGDRCDCSCRACCREDSLLRAGICPMDSGVLPRLTCVKQACELCGLDKVLVCRRKEERNAKLREGKVRLTMSGKKAHPG